MHAADVFGLGSSDHVHVRLRVSECERPYLATVHALADRVQVGLGRIVFGKVEQQRRVVLMKFEKICLCN